MFSDEYKFHVKSIKISRNAYFEYLAKFIPVIDHMSLAPWPKDENSDMGEQIWAIVLLKTQERETLQKAMQIVISMIYLTK